MPPELVVVVVSDLHATSKAPGDEAGSWLTTTTPRTATNHPLVGLQDYLETRGIQPDIVLCAGDLCDRADEAALIMVWADLVKLAEAVDARLIATAGNHDLDSRHAHDLDPRGVLYDLEPPFPALDVGSRDEYWARNFTILDGPDASDGSGAPAWRVVTLNSSAFHGYTAADGPELEHGRVSPRTSRRLRAELAARPSAHVNIMLVHHHLEQLPNVDLGDRSQIKDGEHLATLLESDSPWLVVHGHKHRARVLYAHGEGSSATIFAAGSASAYPYGQVAASGITNQVYILRFACEDDLEELQLGVAAEFHSLSWIPDKGWKLANTDFGLPGQGGFGWRVDAKRLAKRIAREISETGLSQLSYDKLLATEPRLKYLAPTGVETLQEALLKISPPLELRRDEHGLIDNIGQIVEVLTDVGPSASDDDSVGS